MLQKLMNIALDLIPMISMPLESDGDILAAFRGRVFTVGTLSPSVSGQPNGWYAYHVV